MDVAVFWDYEKVRVPRGQEASHAAIAVQKAILALPDVRRIMQRRLYYDARKAAEQATDRVGLSELGWTLVDCPSRGFNQKETIDKKLIVNALFHGVTESERGGRVCVVLLRWRLCLPSVASSGRAGAHCRYQCADYYREDSARRVRRGAELARSSLAQDDCRTTRLGCGAGQTCDCRR